MPSKNVSQTSFVRPLSIRGTNTFGFVFPTCIGTVFDLVPNLFPFLSPSEGATASLANFLWEMRFAMRHFEYAC